MMETQDIDSPPELPKPKHKLFIVGLIVMLALLTGIVTTFSPGRGGPVVILSFLIVVFGAFFLLSHLVLRSISRVFSKKPSKTHVFYVSTIISTGGVFLVGLQTLGQLQLIDVILVLLFEVLLNFYIFRRF